MNLASILSPVRWQTKQVLAARLGIAPRDVEASIEEARKNSDLAILSGSAGYRLATTPDELAANIASRERRLVSQVRTIRGEKRYLRRWKAEIVEQSVMPWADVA